MGFPEDAGGLLVSGGSMANLVGLTVARDARAGLDLPRTGLSAAPRAADGLRVARDALLEREGHPDPGPRPRGAAPPARGRRLHARPARARRGGRRGPPRRQGAVLRDRQRGHREHRRHGPLRRAGRLLPGGRPVAARGRRVRRDGGAGARTLRPRLRGLERADSLAFDLHKWGYFPIEAGCVLVRDAAAQRRSFTVSADYLASAAGGLAARTRRLAEHGPQLSRGFRALKIWMGLKEHGVEKLGRLIQQNVDQAALPGRARARARRAGAARARAPQRGVLPLRGPAGAEVRRRAEPARCWCGCTRAGWPCLPTR